MEHPSSNHQPGYSSLTLISSDEGATPVDPLHSPRVKRFIKQVSSPTMEDSSSTNYHRTSSPSYIHDTNGFLSRSSSPNTPTLVRNATDTHLYEVADRVQNGTYDKLASARKEAHEYVSEDGSVEKRIKSPSPKADGATAPPISPPLTAVEINHLKHYNKEPLINTSATVHNRRNAEYIAIDLPDSASEGTDSRRGSLYDVPSKSTSHINEKLSYIHEDQYDIPRISLYDVPRSTQRDSSHLSQRALPHLPTDYVNIILQNENENELYSEIADHRIVTESRSMIDVHDTSTNETIQKSSSDNSFIKAKSDDTTLRPGQKLAQELAEEEGYILVNPASLPVLRSPTSPKFDDTAEADDEYIEVRRNTADVKEGSAVIDHDYINVPDRPPRHRNGYEEIEEFRIIKTASPLDEPDLTFSDLNSSPSAHEPTQLKDSATKLCSSLEHSEEDIQEIGKMLNEELQDSEMKLVPVVLGSPDVKHVSIVRKRSLTVGDPLDNKEAKKHTYVNVPDKQLPLDGLSPRSNTVAIIKKPMPLPRPSIKVEDACLSIDFEEKLPKTFNINTNSNNNCNSKVKTLIRQFSQ